MELKNRLSHQDEFPHPDDITVYPTTRGETIVLSQYVLPERDYSRCEIDAPADGLHAAEATSGAEESADPNPQSAPKHSRPKASLRTAVWNTIQLVAIGLTLGLLTGAWHELYAQGSFRGRSAHMASVPAGSAAYISPHFGPEAMAQCTRECSAVAGPACISGCDRYSFTQYGRRITLEELDPAHEADEIIDSCMRYAPEQASAPTHRQWTLTAGPALSTLRDVQLYANIEHPTALGRAYRELLFSSNALQNAAAFDGESKAFTGLLQRALCLRAHLTLTELAISIVQANADTFSGEYYETLRGRIGPRALEAEATAFKRAQELQVPYGKK